MNKFKKTIKKYAPWLRSLIVFILVAMIVFTHPTEAQAKRAGGRIGGTSFRAAPRRSVPSPVTRSYPTNSYGFGGGGLFFLPFFIGGGGGSLIGLLALAAIAGLVIQTVRNSGIENLLGNKGTANNITVSKIQIGLLASARQLQKDLNRLAMEADTNTSDGLALLLRETTVSLLRHPEYWVYANSSSENSNLELAEQKFNALAMAERSKLSAEVVSNFNNRRLQAVNKVSDPVSDLILEAPSEYIVITLITATAGSSKLPPVRSAEELNLALSTIGSTSEQQLLAVEILWEPQSDSYTLTNDEVLTVYPSLTRI
ncbi:putative membrane protein [Synechococcus sp. PCC 7502]|uniref:DUF1517 domain-containing protein n=1 Tax=Synechococcus sp. PCC 7502 TaxID=1173263 RepID=UPI00029FDF30|nr:DUF1517 domain-containing protein [Synechococcus sp. PCC 7502]AFY74985.1 putative membrane protein [Synechococcus sp. PCC 7502]